MPAFFAKYQHFLAKIVALLKAVVWELRPVFFSSVFSFCKIKGGCYWKCKFYRLCVHNLASKLLQVCRKLEKWQWPHNFSTWRRRQVFWRCFVSLVNFSYWPKFNANVITGSGVMTIYFYKTLTRNLEI